MPLTDHTDREGSTPKVPHLAVMGEGGLWIAMPPGAWLMYHDPADKDREPTPMLLLMVKPKKGGLELVGACCNNRKCTRRMKLEGKWIGKHYEQDTRQATPDQVRSA